MAQTTVAEVLNPLLYGRLASTFGAVRVTRRGRPMVADERYNADTGWTTLDIRDGGERYGVSCPFCDGELSINHCYGLRNGSGHPMIHLAWCHAHRRCLRDAANRAALAAMLRVDHDLADADIRPAPPSAPTPLQLPADLTRLDHLPPGHPARRFLGRRGARSDRAGSYYGVTFGGPGAAWPARGRLVATVVMDGYYEGWFAVSIGDGGAGVPEVWFGRGTPASRCLYNLDRAREYGVGVIVSDPTAVWTIGPMAVYPLGGHVTAHQALLMRAAFRDTPLVWLRSAADRDPSLVAETTRLLRRQQGRAFVIADSPAGLAPGVSRRQQLRECVTRAAEADGVPVSFGRRTA